MAVSAPMQKPAGVSSDGRMLCAGCVEWGRGGGRTARKELRQGRAGVWKGGCRRGPTTGIELDCSPVSRMVMTALRSPWTVSLQPVQGHSALLALQQMEATKAKGQAGASCTPGENPPKARHQHMVELLLQPERCTAELRSRLCCWDPPQHPDQQVGRWAGRRRAPLRDQRHADA